MDDIKVFSLEDIIFKTVSYFSELDAPDWLTSKNTVKGSTMDNRWFWEGYVMAWHYVWAKQLKQILK